MTVSTVRLKGENAAKNLKTTDLNNYDLDFTYFNTLKNIKKFILFFKTDVKKSSDNCTIKNTWQNKRLKS